MLKYRLMDCAVGSDGLSLLTKILSATGNAARIRRIVFLVMILFR